LDKDHELTEKVIGLAMKVHRTLGPGFLESVYLNALVHELRRVGLSAEVGQRITVRYENIIAGDFFADLIVNEMESNFIKVSDQTGTGYYKLHAWSTKNQSAEEALYLKLILKNP